MRIGVIPVKKHCKTEEIGEKIRRGGEGRKKMRRNME